MTLAHLTCRLKVLGSSKNHKMDILMKMSDQVGVYHIYLVTKDVSFVTLYQSKKNSILIEMSTPRGVYTEPRVCPARSNMFFSCLLVTHSLGVPGASLIDSCMRAAVIRSIRAYLNYRHQGFTLIRANTSPVPLCPKLLHIVPPDSQA